MDGDGMSWCAVQQLVRQGASVTAVAGSCDWPT